jgi:glycerol-3-phosphate dehydrogenase (NAD(P)+)
MAVPCQFLRSVLQRLVRRLGKRPAMICASKGIELSTLSPMSKVFEDELGDLKARYGHLSGPSFAFEVSKELPTSVALGCADKKLAREVQELFSTSYFRVYTTSDYKGVELGGAVKNIIAIAAGISDGLHFGHDSRAALINRGLAEMSRLGKAMGANPQTFMGLSGMGDLVLTCTGDLSRNRQVGMRLGQGQKLLDILGQMKMVAEGVKTTEAVYKLSKKLGVELPITDQVYSILYEGKDPAAAVKDLMARPLKEES